MTAQQRIQSDFNDVQDAIKDGDMYEAIDRVYLRNNNINKWVVLFHGLPKTKTPLQGGKYCMEVQFPPDFPNTGPTCHMVGGFHHYHVYEYGRICHPLVNKWTFKTSCRQLISQIVRMLHAEPIVGDEADHNMKPLIDKNDNSPTKFDKYYAKMREQTKNFLDRKYN